MAKPPEPPESIVLASFKGVRNTTSGNTGDQLVTVQIVLPDKIDDELSYFLSEWRLKHRYDPRK